MLCALRVPNHRSFGPELQSSLRQLTGTRITPKIICIIIVKFGKNVKKFHALKTQRLGFTIQESALVNPDVPDVPVGLLFCEVRCDFVR